MRATLSAISIQASTTLSATHKKMTDTNETSIELKTSIRHPQVERIYIYTTVCAQTPFIHASNDVKMPKSNSESLLSISGNPQWRSKLAGRVGPGCINPHV